MKPTLGPWTYHSPRPELTLGHELVAPEQGQARLKLWGKGDVHGIGCWRSEAALQPDHWYRASVRVEYSDVAHPALSIFARAEDRFLLPRESWRTPVLLEHTFRHAGPESSSAFELYLKASGHGSVEWFEPTIVEADAPRPRMVRVVTAHFNRPSAPLTMEQQRSRLARRLDDAGAVKPDIVALPEFCPLLGVAAYGSYAEAAEGAPDGPTCRMLAEAAKRHGMYVLAGILERRGSHVFNTAVLFGRDGALVGRYDKTHLTFPELVAGISCGSAYPLFDLDFGRIGIHVCYDEWFPEVARYYAHAGAEILFLPVLGGKPMTWRTRALDNRLYFVSAADTPPSMIIDSTGAILAENHGEGFALADIDLSLRKTNAYVDPRLSYGMPSVFPEMRHVLDDDLLHKLHAKMVTPVDPPR